MKFPNIPKIFLIQLQFRKPDKLAMGADVEQPKPSDYIPRSADTFVIQSVADQQTTRGQLAEEHTTLVTEFCLAIIQLETRLKAVTPAFKFL